jgi:two-component system chemotaxis sensor kinase CheA
MSRPDDPHAQAFREEAQELLAELEDSLLELEEKPDDKDLVAKVFRAMHTIKGSGAMFGFDDIAAFTHKVESCYDKVRDGKVPVTKTLINLTLQARDIIKTMLDDPDYGELPAAEEIVSAFGQLLGAGKEQVSSTPDPVSSHAPAAPTIDMAEGVEATYRVRLKPSQGIFATGTNSLLLLDELRSLGECEVVAKPDNIPRLEEIDPECCYTSWDIVLTTRHGVNAIRDVFIFVEDLCEIKTDLVEKETAPGWPEAVQDYKRLGEILVDRGDITEQQLQNVLEEKKRLGELLVDKGVVTPDEVKSALVEQQHVRRMREKAQAREADISSVRVPSNKLDVLVNLVGELVTVQARLTQTASLVREAEVFAIAEEVERLTAELRDNTLNIRMLPIGTTFGRFKRLIRDLSQELGKDIEMTTEGAETELDKTVIERLNDPLVHLIRNSLDHGLEKPDEREAAGKPRTGTIRLAAAHSGANVVIEIRDDGKGLDREAILAKAVEKGLAAPNTEVTDKEAFGFIFQPGFSTAKEVTSVSGRGVGMDVVKRAIDALRGSIDIASEKGRGTTVTIRLPLSLAIIEGLLVTLGGDSFVLPLSIVEECVELTGDDVKRAHGRNLANVRGEIVPYIRLRSEFKVGGEIPPMEQIVVTKVNGSRVGFVVDSVVGEHQTVIKNLGKFYKNAEAVSGATILGDGTVALIVDAAKVAARVETTQARFD